MDEPLPENRFELELEFVQSLASPAYLHFLATSKTEEGDRLLFQDPEFQQFLKYLLKTWSQPEYSRFLSYPHALYFLELIISKPAVMKEWTLPEFRNFCHQQQFLAWQTRHAQLYGRGTAAPPPSTTTVLPGEQPPPSEAAAASSDTNTPSAAPPPGSRPPSSNYQA